MDRVAAALGALIFHASPSSLPEISKKPIQTFRFRFTLVPKHLRTENSTSEARPGHCHSCSRAQGRITGSAPSMVVHSFTLGINNQINREFHLRSRFRRVIFSSASPSLGASSQVGTAAHSGSTNSSTEDGAQHAQKERGVEL
jgi:hypothetical protein